MTAPLRILLVAGEPDDEARVVEALREGGHDELEACVVRTAGELGAALERGPWEVLVCGEGPPGLAVTEVLDAVRGRDLDIPLLVLSERLDERGAGEVMKAGARDCFSRACLGRLPAVVARELEVSRLRRERSLMARVGEVLAGSLDFQETLQQVARLMVPELADWCSVYSPDEKGQLELVVLAHEDPEWVERGRDLDRLFPLVPEATSGSALTWRTGQAQWVPELRGERLLAWARSPEHLRVVTELRVHSAVCVPLRGRRESQGVMTLFATGDRVAFTAADLALFQDVGRRAALALENARLYREAQEAIHLRDDFMAVAAHELRTPLTTLGLQLGSLVQRSRRESSPALIERLERGLRQVRRLGALVESLLDVSLLSTGELPLSPERVDLGELVGEVMERFQAEAEAVGCGLRVSVAPGLVGQWDRMRVEQVVSSLVANALKFGPRQPVEVRGEEAGGRVRVVVEDQGIGVPAEHLERIFERFGRAVSSRSYGGLGLGLYLARRAAEAHGGRVWAEQRPGGGARFTLELPLEPPPRAGAPS
ncbi:ATP-binding response regulator [Cystobacter ferrugineus]|uniref:histidine kinase n=1 Tax=Cystobacter ferrugineus TaxID=83449 RepID=A0A1L9B3B9_9BACT|nr:hybrid sensor histidine kinase/response regulator [Cystobacter ferrugineus]OJH36673.1 histidine kinase [Cystobacter ferrugineus]